MLQKALFLRKSLFPFSYIRQYRILLPLMSSSSIMLTRSLYIRYGNVSLLMTSSFRLVARKTNLFNLKTKMENIHFLVLFICHWFCLNLLITILLQICLTRYMPLISFYTSWKHQKTRRFFRFSGGIERDQ